MKIKMMSRWNASCGVSTHAELIGRAWMRMGYDLKVLAPIEKDSGNRTEKDEPYVLRCYRLGEGWRGDAQAFFDPEPFLEDDFDIFVVQNLEMLPMQSLLKIYPLIRKKAKTVLIVHEGGPPKSPCFYKFDWDAVVCFDERYKNFLNHIYPEGKIKIIPYPCHLIKKGDKLEAREKLGLPVDKKIIFNYGLGVFRHIHLLPTVERLSKKYPLIFLTLTHVEDWYDLFLALKGRYNFIELKKGPISISKLYTYLHVSDALLIHKDTAGAVVVSSTAYLCMGSGCPLLVSDTNFFETLNNEVIKYRGLDDFAKKLEDIFEERENVKDTVKIAEGYVKRHSPLMIGRKFIRLFNSLKVGIREKAPVLYIPAFSETPELEQRRPVRSSGVVSINNPAADDRSIKSA